MRLFFVTLEAFSILYIKMLDKYIKMVYIVIEGYEKEK